MNIRKLFTLADFATCLDLALGEGRYGCHDAKSVIDVENPL